MVARALNLAERQVRVITPYVGGGFGGKSAGMQAIEVARLARAAGYPVLVAWDRREEFLLDTFRPAAVVKIRSGVDGAGRIAFYEHHVYCAGDRGAELPYDVPHQKILASGTWSGEQPAGLHPVGVGPWRAPAANTNVFARESHLDTMARQAGKDPVAFRLAHLTDARMIRVLETAANHFGWTPKALPSGRGFGVAFAEYRDTMVAACAEVDVNRATGQVRVKRVTLAQDMGLVVNPDGARQQIEGCIIMGLGYALSEEVRFRGGEVLDRNFDTYQLPRFSWVPAIETILVPNPGHPAQGGGEPPITVMGAVLANAIHDATGARFLQLPMTPERIRTALA
jgi:CO/xanthine dehydrogenase Mo-binding subunit